MMRFFSFLVFLIGWITVPAEAATGGKGASFAASPAPARSTITTGHGRSGRMIKDPRTPPELDPTRKVSEQDCSKPINLDGGNLRCK